MQALPKITEKEFMSQVIQLARLCGWKVYHTHDSRRSVAGFPDLVLLRQGVLIVAELKVGKNQPTAEQAEWLRSFHAVGGRVFVWYPEHWTEIERELGFTSSAVVEGYGRGIPAAPRQISDHSRSLAERLCD